MSAALYVNPLEHASVRGERIDQGVDYAGTGSYVALGPGVITESASSGTGWPGGFVEEKLTAGPLAGDYVYYAEGVTPTVSQGQTVGAGQTIANLIPGWSSGTELGFGSGIGTSTYAREQGGGYVEGQSTAAGNAFDRVVRALGGTAGTSQPQLPGTAPPGTSGFHQTGTLNPAQQALNALNRNSLFPGLNLNLGTLPGASSIEQAVIDAVKSVFSGFFDWVKSQLEKGALYAVLIVGGVALAAYGLVRTFSPVGERVEQSPAARRAAEAAMVA